jgi:hypothetical protein
MSAYVNELRTKLVAIYQTEYWVESSHTICFCFQILQNTVLILATGLKVKQERYQRFIIVRHGSLVV